MGQAAALIEAAHPLLLQYNLGSGATFAPSAATQRPNKRRQGSTYFALVYKEVHDDDDRTRDRPRPGG